jgi:tRNA dimethylallyltransferase
VIGVAVVTGPTASGKTRLAIELARLLDGEIVSADSQQLYRGLDVGTAKPTAAERAAVPHHLLDAARPGEPMDAARFAALADAAIAEVAGRGRLPIVCGGTGLYIRALLHGIAPAPGRDPALRAELEAEAERTGRSALHARLAAVDPQAAARIGKGDLVRIVRALEIARGGVTQSRLFAQHAFRGDRYRHRILALDLPRGELHRRIDERVEAMFAGGILEEVARLAGPGGEALPGRLPIGYAEAAAVLAGRLDRAEAVRRVQAAHRRYARRQLIWLRREKGVEWVRPPIEAGSLAALLGDLRPG